MIFSIHQPNFIPWIGYFHKVLSSDKVILFDSVQISSGKSYTTRVKILFNGEERWLTIPVKKAGNSGQKICETELLDFKHNWRKNLGTIRQAYLKSPFFKEIFPILESHLEVDYELLCDFNINLIKQITKLLSDKDIEFLRTSSNPQLMTSEKRQTDYIIETCQHFGVVNYLSGKGGSSEFLELEKFEKNGIHISFQKFTHPVYKQIGNEKFCLGMSIIDMLMNVGVSESANLLKSNYSI
ncbi:MAG: WbqC family protein [Bacteroidota bacterium]|nr:WbqC family protein [Bacteroidota bacterium]